MGRIQILRRIGASFIRGTALACLIVLVRAWYVGIAPSLFPAVVFMIGPVPGIIAASLMILLAVIGAIIIATMLAGVGTGIADRMLRRRDRAR